MQKKHIYWTTLLLVAMLNTKAQESLSSSAPIVDQKYTIKDLEILEKEKNYTEFFLHAYDVRPSERTKHWQKIYEHMALVLIDSKIALKDFSSKTFNEIEKISRHELLTKDEVFQNRRSDYAQKYFKECFLFSNSKKEKEICENELTVHWENSNKDPDAALNYVNWLKNADAKIDTWTFYNAIVNDQIAPLYCQKAEVQQAIINKLTLESFKENFNGSYREIISKFISDKCINVLYPTLKDAIVSNKTKGTDKEQALLILEQMKQITKDELDLYYTIYLLDGPVVGEKMNIAWKLIESLAENYPRRVKILNQLKALTFIPDTIFNDPKMPRNKALMALFAKNFPELLDHYSRECLDFLKGKEGTQVTSGVRCNQFLSSDSKEWIKDSIKTEYSALKK